MAVLVRGCSGIKLSGDEVTGYEMRVSEFRGEERLRCERRIDGE